MKYLVVTRSGLGEIAIDIALINAIAQLDGDNHIEVLTVPPFHVLLQEMACINRLHVRPEQFLSGLRLRYEITRRHFDVVLITRRGQQLFKWIAKSPIKRRFDKILSKYPSRHTLISRLTLLDGILDGWDKDVDPTIHFNPDRIPCVLEQAGIERGKTILTIAPGASSPKKTWHKDRFVSLTKKNRDRFNDVVVIGSKLEQELCEYVGNMVDAKAILAGKQHLLDIAGLFSQSTLHIGNDSGLSHVAAGSGAKSVLSIGGISEYTPWNQHMIPGDVNDISVDQVIDYLESHDMCGNQSKTFQSGNT